MNLTYEQKEELESYVQKVVEWLREHADSHTKVIIDRDRYDVVQDVCGNVF